MSSVAATAWPTELKFSKATHVLSVTFDDGSAFQLPAEYLRVESPSAEVQGHGSGQKQTVAGKRSVTIARMEPIGRYAVRIVFNDGHGTGIFTWRLLRSLTTH